MPSHAMLIAIVVTKEDSNSLTQGFAKYQPAKVENLEQYIIVSNVSIIVPNENDQELVTEEVPLSMPHYMFLVLVKHDPQMIRDATYFDAECFQYNSFTNSKQVLMKLRILYPTNAPRFTYIHANNSIKSGQTFLVSGFVRRVNPETIAIEATDIDFMYANNAIISHNRHDVSSTTISSQHSAFDDIVDEIESTISQVSKKTSTRKKKISDLALDCLGLNIVDEQESKGDDDSKAPDDEVEDLEEYVLEERPKKRRRKN
ncbi:17773_t:CDS:2, partial [Cetraspora pellucida]